MATVQCEDCNGVVSEAAEACPHCGAPRAGGCPHCGAVGTVTKVDGLKGAENVAGLLLLALCIVPGIAYYFDRTRLPWCTNCHRRVAQSS